MLPACDRNLKLHLRRSNYVAHTLQHAKSFQLNLDSSSLYGLDENSVRLVGKYFPHDIQDILIAVNQKEGVEENNLKLN